MDNLKRNSARRGVFGSGLPYGEVSDICVMTIAEILAVCDPYLLDYVYVSDPPKPLCLLKIYVTQSSVSRHEKSSS